MSLYSQSQSIIKWFKEFPITFQKPCVIIEDLIDGIILSDILISVERNFFKSQLQNMKCLSYEPSLEVKLDNLKILYAAILKFYHTNYDVQLDQRVDLESIALSKGANGSIIKLVELVLGVVLKSDDSNLYIEKILGLDQDAQYDLQKIIEQSLCLTDDITPAVEEDDHHTYKQEFQEETTLKSQNIQPTYGQSQSKTEELKEQSKHAYNNFQTTEKSMEKIEMEIQLQRKDERNEELCQQLETLEKDRTRLRTAVIKYEEENKILLNNLEEGKIEINELKKHIEIYENKLHSNQESREGKITQQTSTIKELEQEIDLKNKKISQLLKEKVAFEKRADDDYQALRDELDLSKEKIIQLQKNEAIIDVYKKKIDSLAQLKTDLRELQEKNKELLETIDILRRDSENNKQLKETVAYLQEQLSSTKNKKDQSESQMQKLDLKLKDMTNEKLELEKKTGFYLQQIDQLENELNSKTRELKDNQYAGTKEEGGTLLPQLMQERIKKLEKENYLLKQELENKFDKDKIIIQNQLEDAVREKKMLEEHNGHIQEQLQKLQDKLLQLASQPQVDSSSQQKLGEFQSEIDQIMKDRDSYFLKLTQLEFQLSNEKKEKESLKQETTDQIKANQKLLNEKTELYHQFLQEKDKSIGIQQELNRLESQLSILQKENSNLSTDLERLKALEQQHSSEIQMLRQAASQTNSNSQQQEIMAQLLQKNDELKLNSIVSELKLDIRDKELQIKEQEREYQIKERELIHEIEKLKSELKIKDLDTQRQLAEKEKEMKGCRDKGVMSKRYLENIQKEQRIMSGVFHKLAYEMYSQQQPSMNN